MDTPEEGDNKPNEYDKISELYCPPTGDRVSIGKPSFRRVKEFKPSRLLGTFHKLTSKLDNTTSK
jgi:hypothetical protein